MSENGENGLGIPRPGSNPPKLGEGMVAQIAPANVAGSSSYSDFSSLGRGPDELGASHSAGSAALPTAAGTHGMTASHSMPNLNNQPNKWQLQQLLQQHQVHQAHLAQMQQQRQQNGSMAQAATGGWTAAQAQQMQQQLGIGSEAPGSKRQRMDPSMQPNMLSLAQQQQLQQQSGSAAALAANQVGFQQRSQSEIGGSLGSHAQAQQMLLLQQLQQRQILEQRQRAAQGLGANATHQPQRLEGLGNRIPFGSNTSHPLLGSFSNQEALARALGMHSSQQQQGMFPYHLVRGTIQQQQQQQQAEALAKEPSPELEPEPEAPPEETALDKVGKISSKLRSMLGKGFAGDRFAGTDESSIAEMSADERGGEEGAAKGAAEENKNRNVGGLQDASELSAEAQAAEDAATLEAAGKAVGAGGSLVRREDLVTACGDAANHLKSYQLVGINFLMMLHRSGTVGGAILADEMGLGKTAQTISFLGALRTLEGNMNPHLIVCPASLIENWQRELGRWCPQLRVVQYYGRERADVRQKLMRWRRRVRAARREGRLKKPPPGVILPPADEDLQDEDSDKDPDADLLLPVEMGGDPDAFRDKSKDDEVHVNGIMLPAADSGEAPFDIMLATYTMFERENDYREDRAFLMRWQWCYLVADEAHALKNRSSIRTRKLRRVAIGCEHRLLLTGTPLQNSLEELRALLEFLMPSLFSNNDEEENAVGEEEQEAAIERYKALLAPFILRRLKSEVATQLAKKNQIVKGLEMTEEQQGVYKKAVESMRKEVAEASKAAAAAAAEEGRKPARGRPKGSTNKAKAAAAQDAEDKSKGELMVTKLSSQRVNNIFTHLRKVAQHPLLVRNRYSDEDLEDMARIGSANSLYAGNCSFERVHKELMEYNDHALHRFAATYPSFLGKYILPESCLMSSTKLVYLAELLPELKAAGSRVLLFSQWTTVLDILEWFMEQHNLSYVRLDGDTMVEERLALVDKFNDPANGVDVFLLSTRAGGQGLNLTGADVVVLHDVDFNPQVDRQAEDRCHRLGQTKAVKVYRLVTKGTVDESILGIADRKLALDAAVLEGFTLQSNGEEAADEKKKGGKKEAGQENRYMGAILASLLKEE